MPATSSPTFMSSYSMPPSPIKSKSYLPTLPPRIPAYIAYYPTGLMEAPYTALAGIVVDGQQPPKLKESPRSRIRRQVGGTNRWRVPQSLGGDLLGSSQAIKSIQTPDLHSYSPSIIKAITGEHPKSLLNLDPQASYVFQSTEGHSKTMKASDWIQASRPVSPVKSNRLNEDSLPSVTDAKKTSQPPLNKYQPLSTISPNPLEIFHYHSNEVKSVLGPDVLLECLGTHWELHKPYLVKSSALTELLKEAESGPKIEHYYRDPMTETVDKFVKKSGFYSEEYQEISRNLSMVEGTRAGYVPRNGLSDPAHLTEERTGHVIKLKLKIRDQLVTKQALAIALGSLYTDEYLVSEDDLVGVLAAAHALKFQDLERSCTTLMISTIKLSTVCSFHMVSQKYQLTPVLNACERWLELNLVPQLSLQIQLRDLPLDLLHRVIKSSRIFTYNEYHLYKMLCYWIFLKHHPHIQLMPSHSTVLTYFNSLPKSTSLLESEEGQLYSGLFMALRLHGITEANHLDELISMNVIPQPWLLKMLTQHYQAQQGGGDMSLMFNFNMSALRYGFIIEVEPQYHSEIVSLHGFHFELKASKSNQDTYQFYMQRLKPTDPILSFRACDRQTFSLRQDREVRYCIRIQCFDDGKEYSFTTGILTKKFGLGSKTGRSEIFTLENLTPPIYTTFSLLFPPS